MNIKKTVEKTLRHIILMFKEEKKVSIPIQTNTTELLKDKVALITGGSGGIGMAIAESFLKNGAKVIIASSNEEKLVASAKKLGKSGKYDMNISWIVINVLDVKNIFASIEKAAMLFEENRIDILVNSAGVINHSDFQHMSEHEYDYIMNVNVKGTFFVCQAMAKFMIEGKTQGHILNVSSSSALRPAWTPYQISKWAIRGFTLGLADILLPYGIIVNAIAPGPVATAMLDKADSDSIGNPSCPIGRYAKPEEIANLATFMVSDMGNMIVGDTFYITGGSGTISYHL